MLRLVVLAAFALVLVSRPATAQAPAVAVVTDAAGAVQRVELAGRDDVVGQAYVVRHADGTEETRTVTGVSLGALLDAAGIDPVLAGYVEVARPDGGTLLLSRDVAYAAQAPPVVWSAPDGLHLLRPSAGPGDANAADELVFPGGELPVQVRDGKLLEVRIDASDDTVDPGEPVTLSAALERTPAGEPLTFSWTFDDGESAEGETVTHVFDRRGAYDVALGVTSPGDDVGASAVVTIQVGDPPDGPDRKGGGTDPRADAPDSGAAEGSTTPPPPSAAPVVPAPATGGPATPPGGTAAPRRPKQRQPAPPPAAAPPVEQLPVVEGELVSAPAEAAPTPAEPRAARTGRPRDDGAGGGLHPLAWQLGAVGGLLLLGWIRERRSAP